MITKCNCEYQIECLEADEVEIVYYAYHCCINACLVHIKGYRGELPAPRIYRGALQIFIEVVNKVLYTVMLNCLSIDFNKM